jgi:hypothetical protein
MRFMLEHILRELGIELKAYFFTSAEWKIALMQPCGN